MKRGELIGKGMTAEVYEWGKDRVLKLYFDRYSEDWIKNEAKIGTTVHEAGVPSPAVFDMTTVDGRKGIIFQRIFGKSMFTHIQEEPLKLTYFAQKLARLQFIVHQCSAEGLPSQKERFAVKIRSSSMLLGDKVKRILDYIESLPDGISVCHGDFHFNNIIVSDSEFVPIDWSNAYQGNPLGDIARTCLMMSSPAVFAGVPDMVMTIFQYTRWLTYWAYLDEYMRLAKVRFDDIDAWILPVAAAKLRDRIPGEERWLMDIIYKRLEQIDSKEAISRKTESN